MHGITLYKFRMSILPFKRNQDHHHQFPRQQRKVTNWPAYDANLRQRGSVMVWFTDEAIAAWTAEPRATHGGQARYSPLASLTALTLRAVFRLAYRQVEGLLGSIVSVLGLSLGVPDHNDAEPACGDAGRATAEERRALVPTANPCICWWTARA